MTAAASGRAHAVRRTTRLAGAALVALASNCTLIVDNELSKPGGCAEIAASDGTPGSALVFHSGVTAPSFSGPAFPSPGKSASNFGSTLAFLRDGGLALAGGLEGDAVFFLGKPEYTPTLAVPAPGHEGPGLFGCSEIFAETYDSVHDRTEVKLIPGGCSDDGSFIDAGVFPGSPSAQGAALGWAGSPDGRGTIAALLGAKAQACAEIFPLTCIPPSGNTLPLSGQRRVSSLTAPDGSIVWVVATDSLVQLWRADFGQAIGVPIASGSPARIAAIASDLGIAARIEAGRLRTQIFDVKGDPAGTDGNLDLGDSGAHALEMARFGSVAKLRLAWLTGDGQARVATLDATSPASQQLVGAVDVCGSKGASFVAPTTPTTAAVLIGDALYFRHVQ